MAAAVLIVLFASLKSLATLYTDSLWFSSVGQHAVWSTLLAVKVGLFASFGAVFFAALWVNLLVCDRLAGPVAASSEPEDELVRRYRTAIRPYSGRIYAGIALVVALIAASGTIGEWQNWILFRHGGNFGVTDPQFHRDVGFFVFKLPFLSFVVNWSLASLVAIFVITAVFHYLNGGIRPQRVSPRMRWSGSMSRAPGADWGRSPAAQANRATSPLRAVPERRDARTRLQAARRAVAARE